MGGEAGEGGLVTPGGAGVAGEGGEGQVGVGQQAG